MKYLLYMIVCVSLIACGNSIVEKIETKHPNGEKDKVSFYQEIDGVEMLVEEKHYHSNGVLKMAGKFVNGKREGKWMAYFENEQVQSTGVFKNGLRVGAANVYYPNGQLRYEGHYLDDKESGHWKFYNESGKLVDEKDY